MSSEKLEINQWFQVVKSNDFLRSYQELDQSQRSITQARYLLANAQVKARLADDTLTLAQANYINGSGEALIVIDAQRNSQTAHVSLETQRYELELAWIFHYRAIGKNIIEVLNESFK